MDSSSEEALAQLAADVDLYYEKLVLLYSHQLKSFIIRRTSNVQDAEDIVQEAFMRAYVALRRYSIQQRQTLQIRAWLYKIVWNLYCNHISRSKLSYTVPFDFSDDALLDYEDEGGEHPEQLLEQTELRQELEALVTTLPQRYRVMVNLYFFEELRYQEIADILNQPLGTVKVYVHRGIQMLRKSLATQANKIG
jgi:RNA polymerase sigma-70 factor (ECF subfamily)